MRYPNDQHMEAQRGQPLDSFSAPTMPMQPMIADRLEEIQQASRQGDRERASRLSQEATELVPDSVEAWIYRAAFTGDPEQRFIYLNKALSLAPDNVHARHGVYETLKVYLERDPFLRYLEENEGLYRVLTGEGRAIVVPKDRVLIAPYPPKEPSPFKPVSRWLLYSLLGLLLAGLVTVVCAPIAMIRAWNLIGSPIGAMNRRRATMALMAAGFLWVVGLSSACFSYSIYWLTNLLPSAG